MKLVLIPQPQQIRFGEGFFNMPSKGVIGIADYAFYPFAQKIKTIFKTWPVNISANALQDTISLRLGKNLKPGGYRLIIERNKILLEGASPAAVYHGLQTLFQVIDQSPPGKLPLIKVEDWPAIPVRGVYLDIARGRVPTLEGAKRMVDILARYKINQVSLYMQHTFRFRAHPDIGRGASPMTAEDILALDAYCRERYVELVPSLASFGHMETVLKHPRYHRLAEDYGKGLPGYVTPDPKAREWLTRWMRQQKWVGFSLSPANPATYRFLDSLYAEFLPLFSSGHFNACCDETVDLGYGQSYKLCQEIGRGRLYLNHIVKLNELSRKYGKQMMIWGDIMRHYPELIPEIPKDITVLDWGYAHNHNFEAIQDFQKAGLRFYGCPGVAALASYPLAEANISGFAAATFKYSGQGLLNTHWGDNYNLTDDSWHGLLFGAEQAWNTTAGRADFTRRFCRLFLNAADPRMSRALEELGAPLQSGLWQTICFAAAKPIFPLGTQGMLDSAKGAIGTHAIVLDAKFARNALRRLAKIRAVFAAHAGRRGEDPWRVLPYWLFAVDTMRHAARKLAIMGQAGTNTPAARRSLVNEMQALKKRFKRLWLEHNRTSEIRIKLKAYQTAMQAIRDNALTVHPKPGRGYATCVWLSRALPGAGKLHGLKYPADRKPLCFKKREFGAAGNFDDNSMFYDLHLDMFNCAPRDTLVFFACPFHCPRPMKLDLCLGYDGPVKVWIDGRQAYHDPEGTNPANPDKAIIPLDTAAGEHEALIALGSNHGKAWGLFFRLRPPGRGHAAIAGLFFKQRRQRWINRRETKGKLCPKTCCR